MVGVATGDKAAGADVVRAQALDVPSGIRDVLLRRVGRLPDDTQSLLMVAAVADRDLDPDLLEHVTGIDAEHLLLNLEPAIAAGLVTTAEGGWAFGFRHPLIHESLYASVGHIERARLPAASASSPPSPPNCTSTRRRSADGATPAKPSTQPGGSAVRRSSVSPSAATYGPRRSPTTCRRSARCSRRGAPNAAAPAAKLPTIPPLGERSPGPSPSLRVMSPRGDTAPYSPVSRYLAG